MAAGRLNPTEFDAAVARLRRRDIQLNHVVDQHGAPPFWVRPPGWKTLLRIILEQQVSLSSGQATYRRLEAAYGTLTIARLKASSVAELRALGLTRQKASYCQGLAAAVSSGSLRLAAIARMDDAAAREALCALPGIGPWTADVYLLMALRRPNVWPAGDLALIRAIEDLYQVSDSAARLDLANQWQPFRAVAARILWHDYLSRRGRKI